MRARLGWELFFCAWIACSAGAGVDQGGQQDVPEAVETDAVEVGVGEVEFEPAPEVFDSLLEVLPAQDGDGGHELFKLSLRAHGSHLVNTW